ESHDGRAPGADSEEKHEPVSDIDTVVVDSLKALDPEWPIREEKHEPVSDIDTVVVDSLKALAPEWPIREADIKRRDWHVRLVPRGDIGSAANSPGEMQSAPDQKLICTYGLAADQGPTRYERVRSLALILQWYSPSHGSRGSYV